MGAHQEGRSLRQDRPRLPEPARGNVTPSPHPITGEAPITRNQRRKAAREERLKKWIDQQEEEKGGAPLQVQWHPNTLKILKFLRRQMKNKKEISFSSISTGVKRRTAAACFFELLQLKTWGFIELNQDSAYGSIMISAASRFYDEVNVTV